MIALLRRGALHDPCAEARATKPPTAISPLSDSSAEGRKRPHVLHVFPSFAIGGAQVRLATLVEGLGDRFRHTILSLSGDYEAASLLPPHRDVILAGELPRARTLLSRLDLYRRQLTDLAPDLLITCNWGSIEVALANRLVGAPHIHIEDGFGPDEVDRQLARRVWTRRLALARSQVVVPSLTLADIASRIWRLRRRCLHHIPNAIDPRDEATTEIESLGLDLPPDMPRIAWVGALRTEKNPLRALRAFEPIKSGAVLLVIGDGPEREVVEGEADRLGLTKQVRLLGTRTDCRDILMQCDILALSSDTEQMPLVVLEAMDAGLPIASTDVGDVRRMVAPENKLFVTTTADAEFASALQVLVLDERLRRRIGEANRARVRSVYAPETMIQRYGDLFDSMTRRLAGRGS
jgi:glycosyltransferase involved in cell wall biosynthesis